MTDRTTADDILEVIQLAERSGVVKAIWIVDLSKRFVDLCDRLNKDGHFRKDDQGRFYFVDSERDRSYPVYAAKWKDVGVIGPVGQYRIFTSTKPGENIPDLVQIPGVWLLMDGTHNYLVEEHT